MGVTGMPLPGNRGSAGHARWRVKAYVASAPGGLALENLVG